MLSLVFFPWFFRSLAISFILEIPLSIRSTQTDKKQSEIDFYSGWEVRSNIPRGSIPAKYVKATCISKINTYSFFSLFGSRHKLLGIHGVIVSALKTDIYFFMLSMFNSIIIRNNLFKISNLKSYCLLVGWSKNRKQKTNNEEHMRNIYIYI